MVCFRIVRVYTRWGEVVIVIGLEWGEDLAGYSGGRETNSGLVSQTARVQEQGHMSKFISQREHEHLDHNIKGSKISKVQISKVSNITDTNIEVQISKGDDDYWRVKTFKDTHKCLQSTKVEACTSTFLSNELLDTIEGNPKIPTKAIQEQLQKKLHISISLQKLKLNNLDTIVKIDVKRDHNLHVETRVFRRIYVCIGALKQGFKVGSRDILGVDGSFMKGPYPGQILTTIGLDSNNCIYPVTYGMVESESTSSWTWFLECIGEELDLHRMSNFTFILVGQKGVIPAITNFFPYVEHIFCLRHIHENMKQLFPRRAIKDLLWKCKTATNVPHFEKATQLIDGRDKPIIVVLEYIREYLMKRIVIVQKVIDKSVRPITPNATNLFDQIMSDSSQCTVLCNGRTGYQVKGPKSDQCVVNMQFMTCTYRNWEITSMPCRHAVATIWHMATNAMDVGIPED
ncbi:FAR1-related sequence 5-like protein isoform X2 [Tanacetum coccineum]